LCQIPLPIYRLAPFGGDTSITSNLEYRFPIVDQVTFAFFSDFGLTMNTEAKQLRQSPEGVSTINSPLYGCPQVVNGNCVGGYQLPPFSEYLKDVPGTNVVPRMSTGAYLSVVMPIINAPFTIYYAYNPLRMYKDLPQQLVAPSGAAARAPTMNCFKDFFPFATSPAAAAYSYQQAVQIHGGRLRPARTAQDVPLYHQHLFLNHPFRSGTAAATNRGLAKKILRQPTIFLFGRLVGGRG